MEISIEILIEDSFKFECKVEMFWNYQSLKSLAIQFGSNYAN